MKEQEILLALFRGKAVGWIGGDGTRIPVWENDPAGKKESKNFLKYGKGYGKRIRVVKAKIIY